MARMSVRTALMAAAVACFGAASVSASDLTYPMCKADDDCTTNSDSADAGTTICQVLYQTQFNTGKQPTMQWGKCVQCLSDCDCAVGSYCANDVSILTPFWSQSDLPNVNGMDLQAMETMLAGFSSGYKLPGKCVEFGASSDDESDRIGATCSTQVGENDISWNPQMPTGKSFCGYIYSWQPQYFTCVGSGCTGKYKNTNYYQPGQCLALVNGSQVTYKGSQCDNGVAWQGSCLGKECQLCYDGQSKCSGQNGRVCIGNKWHPYWYIDETIRTLNHNTIAQTTTVAGVLLGLLVLCTGYTTFKVAKDSRKESTAGGQYGAFAS